jgi:small-conductance mechanosensitive channel
MSSKRYYNESYKYHDNWCDFLNEQGGEAAMAAQAAQQAEAEAQRAAQEEEALLGSGAQLGQLLTILNKLGPLNTNAAKSAISALTGELDDLVTQEDSVQQFLMDLGSAVNLAGTKLQRNMPK